MANRYIYSILSGLLLVIGILIVYAASKESNITNFNNKTLTTFDFIEVSGPIQPIPHISSIDENWLQLGKALFNSTLLSKDNTVSCASCHLVNQGGDDGFPVSIGINQSMGTRNSPTVLNSVFSFRQFWDGRSSDLADQASGPIHNPIEMGEDFPSIIKKLKKSKEFTRAFNQINENGITAEAIIQAIVTFEESLVTPDAPIDLYVKGDENALTEQQKAGYKKFINLGCVSCHQGVNIGGNLYQKIGRISSVPPALLNDTGRFELSQKESDRYVFKVPSLRNIKRTAPYFHNGSVSTLEEAIDIMAKGQLGITLTKQDTDDLLALFDAFNGRLP
jgi:cytochrome c peroxidase